MIPCDSVEVKVRWMKVLSVVGGDIPQAKCRLELQLQDKAVLSTLPVARTVEGAIQDGVDLPDDEPNTIQVAVKCGWKLLDYQLEEMIEQGAQLVARFEGEVKNRPTIKVVDGTPALFWTVETLLTSDEVAGLAMAVQRDGVVATLAQPESPQLELLTG